jgi:YesN/AraC family two-component response regulator
MFGSQHQGPIHLMLTDVVMPGMNGSKLAKRLHDVLPDMKVLYMSGYTDDAIIHQGILDPEVEYIEKPFSPQELICKVRKILDSK